MADAKAAKKIAVLVFGLLLLAAVATMIVPLLTGIAGQIGTATSTSTTAAFNATREATYDATNLMGTIFSFLPWLGVGLLLMGALKLQKIV